MPKLTGKGGELLIKNRNEYREYLKNEILKTVESLGNLTTGENKQKPHTSECSMCGKEEFVCFPEYGYGKCNECSHEEGFEEYNSLMNARKVVYDEICLKINKCFE